MNVGDGFEYLFGVVFNQWLGEGSELLDHHLQRSCRDVVHDDFEFFIRFDVAMVGKNVFMGDRAEHDNFVF